MATDMAKVRKFEDGLKLFIWRKIVGFLLQDIDSMVRTTMAIEREIEDAWSIRQTVLVARGRGINFLLVRERSRRLICSEDLKDEAAAIRAKAIPGFLISQDQ